MKHMITYFVVLISILFVSCNRDTTFDSALWISAAHTDVNLRNAMVNDLVNRKLLYGLTEKEIIELLGNSEPYKDVPPRELYYTVRIKYNSVDPVYIRSFVVELDKDHKFKGSKFIEYKR